MFLFFGGYFEFCIKISASELIEVSNGKGELFMGKNMLTTKEETRLSDVLIYEESACKKARLYARTLTDKTLADKFNKLADNHEKRFNALFNLL